MAESVMESDGGCILNVKPLKIVADLCILLFFGIRPIYVYLIPDLFERGFFCNDESIMYPFHPKPLTPALAVFFGETFVVSLIILISEIYINFNSNEKIKLAYFQVPIFLWRAYEEVTVFLLGAALTRYTTVFVKNWIGRLRPHFLEVCRPDIDCKNPHNWYVYHQNFTCTNPEYDHRDKVLAELRQSFPCGQLSSSLFCMLYFCIFIQVKVKCKGTRFLKHAFQYCAVGLSAYVAIANIDRYHHHPGDVLASIVQGTLFAIITAFFMGRSIVPARTKNRRIPEYQEIPGI